MASAVKAIDDTNWLAARTPTIVIGTDRMQTIRFLKPGHVLPQEESLVELLSKPHVWQQLPPWSGVLAPGGRL